jgi:hypothetical protein
MIVDQKQIYVEELYDRANRPENLNVELEEEVVDDHKGAHILRSEVEKAIKEMKDKKAIGDDDVLVEALRLLEDDGLNLLRQLINNICEKWRVAKGFHLSYNGCIKEEAKS